MRETVLEAYQRLEAEAVWRSDAGAQGRNVVVSIGAATLTIADLNDVALTHWSLAALRRRNPGQTPAVFSPGADAPETIETDDPDMIEALDRVMRAVRQGGTHRGRIRLLTASAILLALAAVMVLWLPGALARYAANLVPEAARGAIGARMMEHVTTLTGAPCATDTGRRALGKLEQRLFPGGRTKLAIAPSALSGARYLPGGHIVASHRLVEDYETPAVLTAYIVERDFVRREEDAVERLLRDASPLAVIRLLTSGDVPEAALRRHTERLVALPLQPVDIATVAPRVAEAGFSVTELADAVQGEAPPGVTAASPPALTDGDWIALQAICAE